MTSWELKLTYSYFMMVAIVEERGNNAFRFFFNFSFGILGEVLMLAIATTMVVLRSSLRDPSIHPGVFLLVFWRENPSSFLVESF